MNLLSHLMVHRSLIIRIDFGNSGISNSGPSVLHEFLSSALSSVDLSQKTSPTIAMGTSAILVSKDFDYFKLRDKNTEFGREETVLEKEFGLKRKTLDISDL